MAWARIRNRALAARHEAEPQHRSMLGAAAATVASLTAALESRRHAAEQRRLERNRDSPEPTVMASPPPFQNPPASSTATPNPTAQASAGKINEIEGKWLARPAGWIRSAARAVQASVIQFRALDTGRISVNAPSLQEGTRRTFLQRFGFKGTVYKPATIARTNATQLLRGVFSKGSLITGFLGSIGANLYDYGLGSQKDRGLASKEFFVSTGVDFAIAMGTGLAAAGAVAGMLAIAGAAGLTAVATAPVWLVIGATAVVGLGISLTLDKFELGRVLKERVMEGLDAWDGIRENAATIAHALPGYVQSTVVEPLIERASEVGRSVADFFGGLFGGGRP